MSRNIEELKNILSQEEIRTVYYYQLCEHTKLDIKSLLEDDDYSNLSDEKKEEIAKSASEAYAYNGEYDADVSYWDNLTGLINKYKD